MSFVYGFNRLGDRVLLWESLENIHELIQEPWIVCGDFNNILGYDERIGYVVTEGEIKGFLECTAHCELADIPAQGAFFIWSNKQEEDGRRFSRIDRVLVNMEWLMAFPDTNTNFCLKGCLIITHVLWNYGGLIPREGIALNTLICGEVMRSF
ncbi:uncharacterized protein LOC141590304 [Silene latifolia]|uniref:uncharacterized protein LOC141590304 n=1 Tax=Silene latifolia TaxID=37657 RepID=UPI003D781012